MTARLRRASPATLLLVAAAALSAGLLLWMQSHLSFYLDEWDLLLHRRGFDADAFLRPHNEHIVIGPAIVYKAIQATLGMDSARPYQVAAVATFIASVVLFFVWMRRRVGEWAALIAAVAILFLGGAYEDLVSAFQIGYFGSMAFGLATLLLLEMRSRRGDALACLTLIGSVAFSSLGLPFVVGVAVLIATQPRWRERIWVPAVAAVLFAAWWIGWGREADNLITLSGIAAAPAFVLAGIANSVAALFGLLPSDGGLDTAQLDWGPPLVLALGGVAVWRASRLGGASGELWVVAALMLTFWALAGVNAGDFRAPTESRYVYIGAVFVLMLTAELLRGMPIGRNALIVAAGVALVGIAIGSIALRDGYRDFKVISGNEVGGLTALELARDNVNPDFVLTRKSFDYVDAASYLSAADAFGSPALSEQELLDEPEGVRVAADQVAAAANRIELGPADPESQCFPIDPDAAGNRVVTLSAGRLILAAGDGGADLSLGRFSDSAPVKLGHIPGGGAASLIIPADDGATAWHVVISGEASAC